jgi:hypothetical protein
VPDIKKSGSGLIDKIVSDKRSLKNLQLAEMGDDQDGMSMFSVLSFFANSTVVSVAIRMHLSDFTSVVYITRINTVGFVMRVLPFLLDRSYN